MQAAALRICERTGNFPTKCVEAEQNRLTQK